MRILGNKSDKKLDTVLLFLTKKEAEHLIGYLEQLLEKDTNDHSHLMSEDYLKEMTGCLYDLKKPAIYHPRIQKLIHHDE